MFLNIKKLFPLVISTGVLLISNLAAQTKLPDCFSSILIKKSKSDNTIVVDKAQQKAFLFNTAQSLNFTELIKTYDISTGLLKGVKEKRGDMKTPSGCYRITEFLPREKVNNMFGYGAFPINYPNSIDKLLNRDGSGIWLHGFNKDDFKTFDTEGCVRFRNKDLEDLASYIKVNETEVIIADTIKWVDYKSIVQMSDSFFLSFNQWFEAWQNSDMDNYLKYYHPDFKCVNLNMPYKNWVPYKKKIYANRKGQKINLSEIKYFSSHNYVIMEATQKYESDVLTDSGRKTLFWRKTGNEWKIISENWTPLSTPSELAADSNQVQKSN